MGLVVTMSGAKKKSKGVSMPLDAFLSTEDSWADVEDDYTPAEEAPRTTMITVALLLPVVATICLPVVDVEIATLTVTNLLLAAMLVLNCLFLTELLSSLLLETFPSPLPMMISVTSLPSTVLLIPSD